jgi:hypothetical protein
MRAFRTNSELNLSTANPEPNLWNLWKLWNLGARRSLFVRHQDDARQVAGTVRP